MVGLAAKAAKILPASKRSQLLLNGLLAAIQRKSPSENGFEADRKDALPLNSRLLTSNQTMMQFDELFGPHHAEVQRNPVVCHRSVNTSLIPVFSIKIQKELPVRWPDQKKLFGME